MAQYLRAICERVDDGQTAGPIRFTASTEGVKRDGKDLSAASWLLDPYLRNPVVLWTHDYMGRTLPIGKTVSLSVDADGGKLSADVLFDSEDEFARQVESKYRRGFLNAVSVGWDERKDGNELLDISAVPVPGDPDALMERQKRALTEFGVELIDAFGEWEEVDGESQERIVPVESSMMIWRGVATAMVDLLQVTPEQMTEVDRREIYNGLEKLYKRLGKTPPEYLTAAELAALGDEELRGLLLEEEPFEGRQVRFTRAALVQLSQAADLIRTVVDGAAEPEPPEDDNENVAALMRISDALNKFGG